MTPKTDEALSLMTITELQTYANQLGTDRSAINTELQRVRDEVDLRTSDNRLRNFVANLSDKEREALKAIL